MATSKKPRKAYRPRTVVMPLNSKSRGYEYHARIAMDAMARGYVTEDNIAHVYSLAMFVDEIGGAQHIHHHANAIERLCNELHNGQGGAQIIEPLTASVNLLLDWFEHQSNQRISDAARVLTKRLVA